MTDDKSVRIASVVAIVAVIGLGSLSLKVEAQKNERQDSSLEVFHETSRDRGFVQVKREFEKIYPAFRKFVDEQGRFPVGSPGDPSSELRQHLGLSADDLRPPTEWAAYTGMDPGYTTNYLDRRCDDAQKPLHPSADQRDVWFSCEAGGEDPKVVLLWSDGTIDIRPADQRLTVRLRTPAGEVEMRGMNFAFGDETGVPLVYRTVEQRNRFFSYFPIYRPSRMRMGMGMSRPIPFPGVGYTLKPAR